MIGTGTSSRWGEAQNRLVKAESLGRNPCQDWSSLDKLSIRRDGQKFKMVELIGVEVVKYIELYKYIQPRPEMPQNILPGSNVAWVPAVRACAMAAISSADGDPYEVADFCWLDE